jgi:hypothetical protein
VTLQTQLTVSETERNWDLDMAEDIKGEVESKYGPIRKIKVDKMSRVSYYLYISIKLTSRVTSTWNSTRLHPQLELPKV